MTGDYSVMNIVQIGSFIVSLATVVGIVVTIISATRDNKRLLDNDTSLSSDHKELLSKQNSIDKEQNAKFEKITYIVEDVKNQLENQRQQKEQLQVPEKEAQSAAELLIGFVNSSNEREIQYQKQIHDKDIEYGNLVERYNKLVKMYQDLQIEIKELQPEIDIVEEPAKERNFKL